MAEYWPGGLWRSRPTWGRITSSQIQLRTRIGGPHRGTWFYLGQLGTRICISFTGSIFAQISAASARDLAEAFCCGHWSQ